MCDCFHVVLPTWPGAPGSASGHQLQPEEPDVETEEDASVTEGPSGEVIRPQPQGSSPVYECTTEGTGFRVQEDGPSRRGSAGRRASWWKRGSGDARTFSSMSCPESMQEAMEVMFKTEVEAGASGYSVTGGGDQGIFVQQVLKDSSAAKLFSLREGDQLLSATIFFDDIKYEDALKILQYSEPYKVQFQIKRQLCATEGQQDEEAVVRGTETPTKAPGQGGDQEKLTAKPRGARGRKPRERLSWPRLQGLRGTQGAGPRRAHSSSEAHERGGGQEVSPTSTDPEFQLPVEHGEQTAWTASQKRRRRFLNLRLKVGSRLDPSVTGHPDREALGGLDTARVLEEKPEDTEAAPSGRSQERARVREARQALTTQETMELSFPGQGGEDTARQQRKMKQVKAREEATTQRETRASPALVGSKDEEWEELQSLENGTTTMSPQDATVTEGPQRRPQEIQVQIGELKTPKFTFSMEKVQEIGDEIGRGLQQSRPMTFRAQWGHEAERENKTDTVGNTRPAPEGTGPGKDQQDEVSKPRGKQEGQGEEIEKERGEEKWKLSMLKIPEFGRSAKHEVKTQRAKHTIGKRKERKTWKDKEETIEGQRLDHKDPQVDIESSRLQVKDAKVEIREPEVELSLSSAEVDIQAPGGNLQGEVAAKDSKFKMPSFAMSAPSKSMEASLQVCRPKAEADVDRPAIQGDLKTPKVSMQLPSADLDLQAGQVGVKLAQGTLTEAELPAVGTGLKGHLPKVQMPSIKVPKVELKGPQVDIKGLRVQDKVATGEIGAPELEVSHPSVEVDVQAPGGKLQGEVVGKDSKFKMPKFKMPSFGVSAPGKSMEASPEVSMPKLEADVDKPDMQGDLKTSKVNIQLPSADVDLQAGQVGVKLAQGTLSEAQLPTMGEDLKGHLPKVQMPSIKMPKVDLKGPQVDIKGPQMVDNVATGEIGVPELEVSLPSVDVDVRAPGGKLQGEVATKDSKFKMPKFKMPSFSVSAPGKSTEASFEVSVPKMQADVDLPAIQGDLKTPEVGVQLPSADLDLHAGQVGMKVVQGSLPEAELIASGADLKGHLSEVQMPSIKMPKVDLKGPQVDIKGPQMEDKVATGEIGAPELEVSLPSVEVDVQAPGGKLQGEVVGKDSKFKMPKFKIPSFGVTAPGKSMEASLEVSMPKLEADVDKAKMQGDLKTPKVSMQLPSADLDLQAGQVGVKLAQGTLSEAELPTMGAGLKGHLPKVQMPSIKVPKVELKGPQVDIKGLRVQDKVATGEIGAPELEVSHPSVEVDVQAPGGKLQGEVVGKDSKFKMPKFKMPSFGVSAPGKSMEASPEVSMPKLEADVDKAEIQGDLKTSKVNIQLPSADVDLQAGQVGVKLAQGTLSEAQLPTMGEDQKGHLPKVQIPSIKMPKVDLNGPQVDIKGPQMEDKVATGEIGAPELEVSLPRVEVDVQAPGGKLQGEVVGKDSKFKMPKFKIPSFGVTAPGKSMEASLEVSMPKLEADVDKAEMQGDLKTLKVKVQLPSADVDLQAGQVGVKLAQGTLSEAQLPTMGADLKGHLPKVQMPSIKMPKVDLKGPQVDIKGPQMEDKVATGEIGAPELEVSLPSEEVDVQAPGGKLQGEVVGKDSKFKMPKFKMPSFGVSAPGKSMEASLEVSMPKLEADVDKAEIQGDLKTPKVSMQLPSADLDLQAGQVGVKLAQGTLTEAELPAVGTGLKGHLPKVQMPSIKVPKVELKGPQVDIKGLRVQDKVATGEIGAPELEVSHPRVEVDVQAPGGKLQGEVVGKDSKFKMPKFKMPSFGVTAPGKSMEASLEVSMPKLEADVDKPEMQGDLKTPKVKVQLPSADVDLQAGQVGVKLAQGTLSEAELPTTGTGLKGHLPKVQIPKVDLKGPQVDIKGPQMEDKVATGEIGAPELEVSLPSEEVDVQAPGGKLQGEVVGKDSKFKMPKFKMPSFGVSAPGKSMEASLEVSMPKLEADVDKAEIQGDLKTPKVSMQLPSADLDLQAGQVGVKLAQGTLSEAELPTTGAGLKGHLPKVQMPSIKVPKVELKGPQVDIKGLRVQDKVATGEIGAPELEVSHPSVEVDVQAPGGKLQGEVVGKDSKFKMPKFKIPSFGVTAPGKSMEASLEVSMPKLEADVDKAEMQGDLKTPKVKVQLPSADVDLQAGQVGVKLTQGTLSEAQLPATGADLKGHLPKVQMPSIKMPKVDLKGPQVDIKGPQMEDNVATGEIGVPELEVSLPSVDVDVRAPGGKLQGEVVGKDSKFKMPKFKMPSFSVSAPGKSTEASFEVSVPKMQADVDLPAIQGDLKTPEVGVQLPSADLDLHAGQVGMKVVQGSLPEAELIASGADLKGHLSEVQMPSIKMPKVDLNGPQVDIKGPQMEDKVATGEIGAPELEVSLPSVEVDVQAPGGKLQGEVVGKDSKFKMPKFKIPSFGVSAPGKSMEASLEVSMPKLEADVDKAEMQGDLKTPKVKVQLPSADVDLQAGQVGVKLAQGTLSEAELPTTGAGLKGHLPKVQMPSIKVPKVELKGPQVDIKGLRVQDKVATGEIGAPELEVSHPSVEVDVQAPGGKLQGEVVGKDSKFKMPKFKMPSFGVTAPGKSMEASLEVSMPKLEADVDKAEIQGDLKTPKVSMQLPSADLDLQAGQVGVKLAQGTLSEAELPTTGAGLKGHLPKVQMPSIKVPKVELKGPQVDIKGLRVQDKVATGEIGAPELEVSHPSVEVDVQAPGGKLQGEVVGKDSKFKMPKFKMPSFGVSAPGKSMEASPEVSMPKLEADVDKAEIQGDLKTSKVNIQLPSADVDLQAGQVGVKLAQGTLSEAELPTTGADLKGHLPKVQIPSIKMPKVDLKGPQVDIKGPQMEDKVATGEIGVPELEVSLPSVEVDVQAPGGKLQGEVVGKDSKFKMPKFKMPSFSVSAPGKSTEASFEVSVPKMQADVDLPAIQGDLKTPEVGVQLPSADLDLHAGQVGMKVVQGSLPEAELIASGADLKGHLPKVQMPSIKMPKVDLKGPQVDIKGPQMEDKVATGEIGAPELEVSHPRVEVDVQAPGGKLQGEVVGKDSKFKMPKFKMPSFGVTAPGKSMEASLEVSMPKLEADVDKAEMQGDLKTPKVKVQLPSADVDLQAGQVGVKLTQGTLSEAQLPATGADLKGHLPKVQMPSIKMPKVDLKGPQVDIKGLRVQDKVATGEIGAPELEVSHPSVEVDVQAPGGKLQGEVVGKDSKFKMPKFKMPSFSVSAPGKSTEASFEVSVPKMQADVDLPAIQGDLKTPEVGVQLPSADLDLHAGQVGMKVVQGSLPEAELIASGADLKGHLPKVQMPSIKMPKVDLKGPQVDIKGPQMEDKVATGEIGAPELEVSHPSVEVDVQAPGGKLQGEVVGKDSKFKMPKFKMPSFGVTAPGKSMEASLEVSMPKLEADVDKAEIQGDLKTPKVSMQLPSADLDLQAGQVGVKLAQGTLSEAELPTTGAGLKGHLPKVQMPSIKVPKVELKGPQVDIKGLRVQDKVATGEIGAPELEVSHPSVEVDVQAPGGKLQGEVVGKDSKFKMPKFKMPSFSVSAPGKSTESSFEVSVPKMQADVDLPAIQGDLKTPEVGVQLPSADLDLHAGQVGMKVVQGSLPEAELIASGADLKGHLPKVQMPSIKMPKVDLKGPQVDIKGPQMEDKVATGEIGAPELEVSHPRVEVDVQAPGGKLQGEVVGKDSKFKMPKFKMPSFGVTAPGKSMEASLEVSMPKLEADVDKAEMQGDLKTPKVKVQLPSADVDLQAGQVGVKLTQGTLSEAQLPATGADLKGHLPKVQMPSIKMPKVDLKGPQVDIKGLRVQDKVATGEIGAPELEVSHPSVEVDVQAPGGKLQGEVVGKDSKFKMPKFKMPSFSVSAPGKSTEASFEVSVPKMQADVDLPAIQGDLKTPEVGVQLPSADLDLHAGQVGMKVVQGSLPEAELIASGADLKGHLPKVQMPSIKMPKVDLKGPQVDIKGPQMEDKVATGEIGAPELEVSHPSVEVDVQAPGGKLQGEVVGKDSKFKMPKFKMPSFGVSAPGKSMEASLEVSMPKLEADVDKPEMQGDLKTSKVNIQLPSADVDLQAGQVGVKLAQGTLSEAQLPTMGEDLKGHLPKVQMPSIKMPKVDLNGPQVDIKGPQMEDKVATGEIGVPELEVSLPSVDVDVRAPGGKLQGEVVGKDSKFKMPKFKIPSFSVSAPGKSTEASFEVSVPKMQADVDLPAIQGDLKTPEVGVQLPSADLDLHAGQVGMKVVQGSLPEAELIASGADLKGHLSEVQMPSIKMPKVDLKGPQVDIKGPQMEDKVATGEIGAPELEVSLPRVEVDVQAPGGKLQGEVVGKDSKFKMPKFKIPSFGVSAPGKSMEASLEVSVPKVESDLYLPAIQDELKTPEVGVHLTSADVGLVGFKLAKGLLPDAELLATCARPKAHQTKLLMPSIKMPKVELKGSHVDIKSPRVEVQGAEGEFGAPELEVSLPTMKLDVLTAGAQLEAEVETKDSKLHISPLNLPSLSLHTSHAVLSSRNFMENLKFPGMSYTLAPGDPGMAPDECASGDLTESGVSYPFGKDGKACKSKQPPVEKRQVQLCHRKALEGVPGPGEAPSSSHLSGLSLATSPEAALPGLDTALQVPRLALSGLPSLSTGTADLTRVGAGPSVLPPSDGVMVTQFQVPMLSPVFTPGAPQDATSGSPASALFAGVQCSVGHQAEQGPLPIPPGRGFHPKSPLSPRVQSRVTFPMFHKPRFVLSVPLEVAPEADSGSADWSFVPLLSQEPRQDCIHAAKVAQLPVSQPPSTAVPASQVVPELLGPAAGRAAAGVAEQEGKGSPSKTPRFKLPVFSWSPKKEARPREDSTCHLEDPTGSLAMGLDHEDPHPGAQDSRVQSHMALTPEREGDSGRTRKAGFVLPRLALPKLKAFKGPAGLRPPGDADAVLCSSTAAGDCGATERGGSEGGVGSTGLPGGPHEEGDVTLQLPQTSSPWVGSAKLDLGSFPAEEGASQCDADPRCDSAVGGGSEGFGLRDISARQPQGEGTAPNIEGPLKAPLGHADRVPSLGSPEEAPTAGGPIAGSQERWFRMPRLHMPGFRRLSSKERGGARGQDVAQVHMPVATAPAEAAAVASVLVSWVPGSEVEASVSLKPPDVEAAVTASGSASRADVLKRDLDCSGLKRHPPSLRRSGGDQPGSKVQVHPAEGSFPPQKPSGEPSEAQAPAAERPDLMEAEEGAELRPSGSEGPVPLRVSSTDMPSQVSVLDTRRLWEDSVLTVTFPKLRVPMFSFPAPGAEMDIFFPVVRDVSEAEAGVDPGPGLWGASLLRAGAEEPREQPMGPSRPLEGSPVSKVKVHIQGVQAESREVLVCSQVRPERVEHMAPEAFSTQTVWASEIPASTVQTPSYGFSLLKLKTLGPPAQAPDSRAPEGSAAPTADSLPEDGAPDATEPFEVIAGSTSLPGLQTLGSDDPARPPLAGSGSDDDDEPAEILEFLPEDSSGASAQLAAEDQVPKGRPEGKKPSGLLWSWLPNIGFSSISETNAGSRDDAQRSVPVLTQPGPWPDLEPPKRQERVGWFRFPKLGFSSSPAEKTKSTEEETALAEQKLWEESVTFFDARESFSPEEEERGSKPAEMAPGTPDMVASSARTELILLEPDAPAGEESGPRPAGK